MPVLVKGSLALDHIDAGQGPPVVLIHSSVSANRQWRALTAALTDRYRVLAPNLFGYGATTPWPEAVHQSLYAQAQLVLALCDESGTPVHLVGHSTGGSVALKAALLLGSRVASLTLMEPNPFYLLKQHGRIPAYLEACTLRDHVKGFGALGDWPQAAERFADYWLGDGTWSTMPATRRAAFAQALPPVVYEWDAVMEEETTVDVWKAISAPTLVVSDAATRRPIRELVDIFATACPHWRFHTIAEGGHMAPLTRPDLVNPVIRAFLDAHVRASPHMPLPSMGRSPSVQDA